MTATKTIIVDINGCRAVSVDVSQGDRQSRAVSCRLMADGTAWAIPEGATARVAYTLPDGTEGLYDRRPDGSPMWQIDGNTVTVELADQLMTQAGMTQMSILVIGPEGSQLATWPIRVNVTANSAAGLTVPENMPPYGAAYEGKLLYGGPGGVLLPLTLGPELSIRDGVLRINIATSGDAVSINIDDAGILHVYQDGAEVIPVVDDAGDLTWPGLDLIIDDAGNATLQTKEE